jgi:hypothetical protein
LENESYVNQKPVDEEMTKPEAQAAFNPPEYDDIPMPKCAVPAPRLELDAESFEGDVWTRTTAQHNPPSSDHLCNHLRIQ